MNDIVTVKGTGIVDALTLSGESEIKWNEAEPKNFTAGMNLNGDLEAIIDGKTIHATSLRFMREPLLIEGKQDYTLKINDKNDLLSTVSGDYYLITVGQLKRYFKEQIPIESDGGVSNWDEIFNRVSKGGSLVLSPENNGYARLVENGGIVKDLKPGEDKKVRELVRPLLSYWNQSEDRILILNTLKPLRLEPMQIRKLYLELDGELKLLNPHLYLNNRFHAPKEITIRGSGSGEIHFYNNGSGITLQPKLAIKADYAKIGTGELDLYRTERDGQVMHISSVTSEELRDCSIDVAVQEKTKEQIEAEEAFRLQTRRLVMRQKIAAAGIVEALGLAVSYSFLDVNGEITAMSVAAITAAGLAPCYYFMELLAGSYSNSLQALRQMDPRTNSQMLISYSGIQTSRWLEQHPEYLEFAERMRNPEAL